MNYVIIIIYHCLWCFSGWKVGELIWYWNKPEELWEDGEVK